MFDDVAKVSLPLSEVVINVNCGDVLPRRPPLQCGEFLAIGIACSSNSGELGHTKFIYYVDEKKRGFGAVRNASVIIGIKHFLRFVLSLKIGFES
jgi:hypothetical protein